MSDTDTIAFTTFEAVKAGLEATIAEQAEKYRTLRQEYRVLQEKYLTLRDGAVFVDLLDLVPQHDSHCDEMYAAGMRCHCAAWFYENR